MKYILKDLFLGNPEVRVIIIGMGADVDDPVHVQVQVIELWDLVLLHHLTQAGVPLRQPSIEFGHTHRHKDSVLSVQIIISLKMKQSNECVPIHFMDLCYSAY